MFKFSLSTKHNFDSLTRHKSSSHHFNSHLWRVKESEIVFYNIHDMDCNLSMTTECHSLVESVFLWSLVSTDREEVPKVENRQSRSRSSRRSLFLPLPHNRSTLPSTVVGRTREVERLVFHLVKVPLQITFSFSFCFVSGFTFLFVFLCLCKSLLSTKFKISNGVWSTATGPVSFGSNIDVTSKTDWFDVAEFEIQENRTESQSWSY